MLTRHYLFFSPQAVLPFLEQRQVLLGQEARPAGQQLVMVNIPVSLGAYGVEGPRATSTLQQGPTNL